MKSVFSENLIKARNLKGWSQKGAAEAIGIKRSLLSAYERGAYIPPKNNQEKICKAYEVDDLLSFMNDVHYFHEPTPNILHHKYTELPAHLKKAVRQILGL